MIQNKFSEIFSFENLYKAHLRGRKAKRDKKSIIKFEIDMLGNLKQLQEELFLHKYRLSSYNSFVVYEPKKRQIQTLRYRDRVVQHVLCDDILMSYFSERAVLDNCVCQEGKGAHFALDRLEKFLKSSHNKRSLWVVKGDIRKYFPSIPHDQLVETFCKHIKDEDLKNLIIQIVDSYHTKEDYLNRYHIPSLGQGDTTNRGIPIGNQISQIFGMFFLNPLDRLVKEKLRVRIYTRYMDDFVLVLKTKAEAKSCLKEISKVVDDLGLILNPKTQILPFKNGFNYLGFHFFVSDSGKVTRTVVKKTKRRMRWRIRLLKKLYDENLIDEKRVKMSGAAFHGHLCHSNSKKFEEELRFELNKIIEKEN